MRMKLDAQPWLSKASRAFTSGVFIITAAIAIGPMSTRSAFAQSSAGAIAGLVRDSSGGVLPGVTVEAASPALIERVRAVFTDGQGQYKIVDLRPGVYTVTFSLPGFNTVRREGIELTANFSATVNVDMQLGSVEETITVAGASPVVDTQNVVRQATLTREMIDVLPTAKNWYGLGALVPGVRLSNFDVGGTNGESATTMEIHGGRGQDQQIQIDGMTYGLLLSTYSINGVTMNDASTQEVVYEIGAVSAEVSGGGVRVNVIPKEGANLFSGSAFANLANHRMQGSNYTDALRSSGLRAPDTLDRIWDTSLALGGPIKHDRVWFFGAYRYWGTDIRKADTFYAVDPAAFVFVPDIARGQAVDSLPNVSANARVTWQVTPKNKVNVFYNFNDRVHENFLASRTRSPEAANHEDVSGSFVTTTTYTATLTPRLLLDAGFLASDLTFEQQRNRLGGGLASMPTTIGVLEQSTGMNFRAALNGYSLNKNPLQTMRASLSYVTGSHALKAGWTLTRGKRDQVATANGDISYRLFNGIPDQLTMRATPTVLVAMLNADMGLYVQDKWTFRRLTANLALRFDYVNQSVPPVQTPGGRFVGPRSLPGVDDVPNWKDIGPRIGLAYDLFGNGKTALKATLSRYVVIDATATAQANAPINTTVNTANRQWNDANRDYVPDCDFSNPAANLECGPLSNLNFGRLVPSTTYSPDVLRGWGRRPKNWEFSGGIAHELLPRVSAEVTYYRRWFTRFTATDNVAVTPADYDPFCLTGPVDPRLPGGGGERICGLYDLNPSKFGKIDNVVTFADDFGVGRERVFDGVDINMNGRPNSRSFVSGGVSIGRTIDASCIVIDSPVQRFCRPTPPFQPNIKLSGGYTLPLDIRASATLQSIPGTSITATYAAPNSIIAPSLGRNLSGGATYSVELVEPGTLFTDRVSSLDVRVTKIFRVRRMRIEGMLDVYNTLNASPVLAVNNTYGPDWQKPSSTLQARFAKVGARLTF